MLKKIWIELSNHNRYKSIAFTSIVIFIVYCNGCQIKCNSILQPGNKITAEQLQAEYDIFMSKLAVEVNSINREQDLRSGLYKIGMQVVTANSLDWFQVVTSIGSLIGIGAIADNVRFRIKTKNA